MAAAGRPRRTNRQALQQDAIVDALVPDASEGPPNTTVLHGFLGKSTSPDHWRLYLTESLDVYVEIEDSQILHSKKLPDDGGTLVWVSKSLSLTLVQAHSQKVEAEFLGGAITEAHLGEAAASPAAARTAAAGVAAPRPSLITICQTVTIRCPTTTTPCLRPSLVTICPSVTVRCPTTVVPCLRPSLVTICPTVTIRCPTSPVICRESLIVICRTVDFRCITSPSFDIACPTEACPEIPGGPGPFGG